MNSPHALLALVAFAAIAVPADAAPLSSPSPYAQRLGCTVQYIARADGQHKQPASYAVRVVDTLGYTLVTGTTILYGVNFSDGTTQNNTISLGAPVTTGGSETVGGVLAAVAPTFCTAGIPPAPRYSGPSNGGPGTIPISSSPKPVVHEER